VAAPVWSQTVLSITERLARMQKQDGFTGKQNILDTILVCNRYGSTHLPAVTVPKASGPVWLQRTGASYCCDLLTV
jgi:hypothetical protein